uniref:Seipin n=1 Tax=Wuchereria bancrofti TaxID=6293 RepID=A0A1I8EWD5_WUCBA
MLVVKKISSWIRDRLTIYHIITAILQLFGAFVVAVISPFLLRQLLLPSLVEYTVPLHFNFETCREQLAGVCSFPTAVVDFSMENLKLSPGENYEISVEIILSESTIASNVGIFQAVVELVDPLNMKRTFRKSCFVNRHHSLIYRIVEGWWNLACQTLFFPVYFLGLLTMSDNRKLEVSFTNHLVDSDLENTALLYVQLQNRFIEVESGKLSFRIRFGLLRVFLHDYPIISSLLIIIFVYLMCLTGIALYWLLQALFGFFAYSNLSSIVPVDETNRLFVQPEDDYFFKHHLELKELKRPEIADDVTFLTWNDLRRSSNKTSESSLHRRKRSKEMKQ